MCGVSAASISRWAKQLHPKKRLFPRPVTSDALVASVDSFMRSKTRCSSREVVDHILTTWEITISRQLAHCIIRRLGFTFKRIRKHGKRLNSPSLNEKLEAFSICESRDPHDQGCFILDFTGCIHIRCCMAMGVHSEG